MICAQCTEETATSPCSQCGGDPQLDGRYRLDAIVGRGAAGITYRATRIEDGLVVAIKEMAFHRIDSEKIRGLFERETRVLQQLDHPNIPDYVDHFISGVGRHRSLYLAQTFIDGPTLATEMEQRRYREDEVLAIVVEVARILVYLHDLRPPVIHRDLKPGNLMRRGADGEVMLVDFGAVRDALADPGLGGSTVVGTYGFMAPEQYRGDASPATDLYALGVTAAVLLSRQSAETLSDAPGHIDWQSHLEVHPATAELLDRLMEADPNRRLSEARKAIALAERAIAAIAADRDADRHAPPAEPERVRLPDPDPGPPPMLMRGPSVSFDDDFGQSAEAFTDAAPLPKRTGSAAPIILGMGLFFAVIIVVATVLENTSTNAVKFEEACGGQPCRAPHGLKGLEFGMTVEQARAKLPELAEAAGFMEEVRGEVPLPTIAADGTIDMDALLGRSAIKATLPGHSYTVKTTIGGFGAECQLDFVVDETLSKIACTLDGQPDVATHKAAADAIFAGLVDRYGPPRDQHRPPDEHILGVTHAFDATWSDDIADAALRSKFQSFGNVGMGSLPPDSDLTLVNASRSHHEVVEAAREEVRRRAAAAEAARERKARQAAEEARRRIESSKGKLDDDL